MANDTSEDGEFFEEFLARDLVTFSDAELDDYLD